MDDDNKVEQMKIPMKSLCRSANFDEKVHKTQSRSFSRVGAKMQLFDTYLMNLNTSISASRLILGTEGLQGTHMDELNTFTSKLITLTAREG